MNDRAAVTVGTAGGRRERTGGGHGGNARAAVTAGWRDRKTTGRRDGGNDRAAVTAGTTGRRSRRDGGIAKRRDDETAGWWDGGMKVPMSRPNVTKQ